MAENRGFDASWRDVFFTSQDGLKLYARDFGPQASTPCPVLCLCGLTRNSKDFHNIASLLSHERRVIVPDYRGRGKSQNSSDPQTYQPDVELTDALVLLDKLGIEKVCVIGTSRGGLIAMIMGVVCKERLTGVFFNDIGPKLEDDGLLNIVGYLGVDPGFRDWEDAVASLRRNNPGFQSMTDDDWQAYARRLFADKEGAPVLDYDPALKETFPTREFIEAGKIPETWELFDTLSDLPVGLIRGENSNLLSIETAEKMAARHPGMITATIPDRGHVPFLDEPASVAAVKEWLVLVDGK